MEIEENTANARIKWNLEGDSIFFNPVENVFESFDHSITLPELIGKIFHLLEIKCL